MKITRELTDLITLGTYVIGVKDGEKLNFMSCSWLTRISSYPETILAAVNTKHLTASMIESAKKFSVNVLSPDQEELAKWCGFHTGRKIDKTQKVIYKMNEYDVPVIDDCAGHLTCELRKIVEYGDHLLFIAEIVEATREKEELMDFHERNFYD